LVNGEGKAMTDTSNDAAATRARTTRRYVAGVVTLAMLAVIAAAWFWITRQPSQTEVGVPYGTIVVVSGGALVAALIAAIRMSLADFLELALDIIVGLFAVPGAILKGLWNFVCGLFGWD
jgi:hypothetical protein